MKENIKLARILLTDFDTFSDFQIEKVTTHYSKKKKKKNIESWWQHQDLRVGGAK